MIRLALAAALIAGLAGCAQTTALVTKISTFTVADLIVAEADAKAHSDTVAAMCYAALIPLVGSVTPPTAPAGAVSAFQDIRDGINTTSAAQGLLKQLEVPCGPLAADVNLTLTQLIIQFGGAAAGVPALPLP